MFVFLQTSKQTGPYRSTRRRRRSGPSRWYNAELIDTIVDGGESTKSLKRPGMAVAGAVDAGEVQTVIIAMPDRLTSSVKDLCTLLERFSRRGVALVSVAESLGAGSAAGRLALNIMTAVSRWEREAIGDRTRDVMSHNPSQGQRVREVLDFLAALAAHDADEAAH
jgi:site-specific DNA recombinase